jgi:hypothetical protein
MGYKPPKGIDPPQLKGKRTGRPKGSRNYAKVWEDLDWAYRHLDEEPTTAPSQNALMWWRFGNTFPEQFRCFVKNRGRVLTKRDIDEWEDLDDYDDN